MASGLTWQELRDLRLSGIEDAADGWADVGNRASAARPRVDDEMTGRLGRTQEGEAEKAAVRRLRRLSENFRYIHTECGLVRTALDGLARELRPLQRKLRDALDDAAALRFTVHADGSVSYPAGGEEVGGLTPPGGTVTGSGPLLGPALQRPTLSEANPNRAKAQDIADRIFRAVDDARSVDDGYATAIRRLRTKPGLDVNDAMWADAYRDAAVTRKAADDHLGKDLPHDLTPAQRKEWWASLDQEEREQYLALHPHEIGSMDGIPAETRDAANRAYLPLLMGKLEAEGTPQAETKLAGLREIDRKLRAGGDPPIFLLGIGDEGNGRAIVSYGNPDTSRNVSAYVPGLGTALDEHFAKNDLERARHTAVGAREYDPSSASIVWLGYDAPQLPADRPLDNLDVMHKDHAAAGAPAYNSFMDGLAATNRHADPHLVAIGHSYGSLTVGLAAQERGGIPGVDDIILLGSPGVDAQKADELGVGKDHVYVGSADNDPVTMLPSKKELGGALIWSNLGPLGSYLGYELSDIGNDDIWFGKDPASEAFGAKRFLVDDGYPPFMDPDDPTNPTPAHSNYFNPEKDQVSADNIAAIVSGHPEEAKAEEHR
ncbi:alpha/beta hydrolase [Streptomyces megasporus]|uniref:alpha/beta hydrolase n=1 Tax=Streptomyces megasporus TaxID=44060 RepID=UPI0004E25C98|nr:alpha/beta hydrolase [Streptomyces megasporus]